MPEAPAELSGPQRDLFEEMHYALTLAEERERSATEDIDRLRKEFAAQCSRLEKHAKSAEKDAEHAELKAAEAENRVNKSLEALRVLRRRLASHGVSAEGAAKVKR